MKGLTAIKELAIKKTAPIIFRVKKYSPEIMIGASVVTGVATVVFACKAAKHMDEILEEFHMERDSIKELSEEAKKDESVDFPFEKERETMLALYFKTLTKYAKLFAPAAAFGIATIVLNISGHKIVKKRLIKTAAAYKIVSEGFDKMYKNTVEKYGEDVALMLKHGIKEDDFKKVTVNEKGEKKEQVVKEKVCTEPGIYARFFDSGTRFFKDDPSSNLLFCKGVEDYYNKILLLRGHVFLNEVYNALGFEMTDVGSVVGWKRDAFENGTGDGYISLGIYDIINARAVNEMEPVFLLDFNVDKGLIFDKLNKKKEKAA